MPTLSPCPSNTMLSGCWLRSGYHRQKNDPLNIVWRGRGGGTNLFYIRWASQRNYTFFWTGVLVITHILKHNSPGCENATNGNLSKTMESACEATVLSKLFAAPIILESWITLFAGRTSMSSKVRGHMWRRSHASATGGIEKRKDFGNRLHGVLKSIWLTFAVASKSVGDKAYNA